MPSRGASGESAPAGTWASPVREKARRVGTECDENHTGKENWQVGFLKMTRTRFNDDEKDLAKYSGNPSLESLC